MRAIEAMWIDWDAELLEFGEVRSSLRQLLVEGCHCLTAPLRCGQDR